MDILKVACFALVSVLSWELGVSKLNNLDYFKLQEKNIQTSTIRGEDNITDKLGEFMMSEIIKGGEK